MKNVSNQQYFRSTERWFLWALFLVSIAIHLNGIHYSILLAEARTSSLIICFLAPPPFYYYPQLFALIGFFISIGAFKRNDWHFPIRLKTFAAFISPLIILANDLILQTFY